MLQGLLWLLWGAYVLIDKIIFAPFRFLTKLLNTKVILPIKKALHQVRTKLIDTSKYWIFIFNKHSEEWAKRVETPSKRKARISTFYKWMISPREEDFSALDIYELLRLYILTSQWSADISIHPFFVFLNLAMVHIFPMLYWLLRYFAPEETAQVSIIEIFWGVMAIFLLITSLFVFLSILKQIPTLKRKFALLTLIIAGLSLWVFQFSSLINLAHITVDSRTRLVMSSFAPSAILIMVSTAIFLLQWRLLYGIEAIVAWVIYSGSFLMKRNEITRIAAWIILIMPNILKKHHESSTAEIIDHIQAIAAIEREGAEWRTAILAILTFIGIANIDQFIDLPSKVASLALDASNSFSQMWLQLTFFYLASPAFTGLILTAILFIWGILLELWLPEIPNQIIALACIEAKEYLLHHHNIKHYSFKNYRVVKASSHQSPLVGQTVQWNLVDTRQIDKNSWISLIEARTWLEQQD